MILLVDVGNSAIKWAILEKNSLNGQQYVPYKTSNLDYTLTQIWQSIDRPEAIWISNVAGPKIDEIIIDWTTNYWQCQPNFIRTTKYKCGVKNGYKHPEQLGIDRWLALIGAYNLEVGMLCIVDCGTAITMDVLMDDGQHLGGIIAPGLNTMQTALSQNTYKLIDSKQFLTKSDSFLASNTNDGIIFGTSYAILGMLEYVMNKLENKPKLILTGGNALTLKPFLSKAQYIPDLVLQGLKTVINYHEKSSPVTISSKY